MQQRSQQHEKGVRRISSLVDAWWKILLIFAAICSGVYSMVVFWINLKDSITTGNENQQEIKFIKENYATKHSVDDLSVTVNKQEAEQHERNHALDKEIDEIKDWTEFERGRQAGRKEILEGINNVKK